MPDQRLRKCRSGYTETTIMRASLRLVTPPAPPAVTHGPSRMARRIDQQRAKADALSAAVKALPYAETHTIDEATWCDLGRPDDSIRPFQSDADAILQKYPSG